MTGRGAADRHGIGGRRPAAALLAAALAGGVAAPAAAGEAAPSFDPAATLTGDWGGARSRLFDRGIGLTLGYVAEAATNPRGGASEKARWSDQLSFGSHIDLGKLLAWRNAGFEWVVTDRNGRNLGDDAGLQTLQGVQEVYGRGQTWRLTRLSLHQTWLGGAVDLKLGRLPVGDDFAAFPCNFQNLTFCGSQPGNVRGELWYSYPVSQWGSRLKVALGGEVSAQVGLYQVNPRYVDDSFAHHQGLFPNNPSGTTGALLPVEFAWTPKTPAGLAGSYKVGAWYDSSRADDVALDSRRQPIGLVGGGSGPLQRGSRRGAWLNFQQRLTGQDDGPGATAFLNITQSDQETAPAMDRQIAAGLTWRGLVAGRPTDTVGLAIGSNRLNPRVADRLRLASPGAATASGSEKVGEVFYAWMPVAYLSLQPNLQWVRHPGGFAASESVVVLGLRTSVDF